MAVGDSSLQAYNSYLAVGRETAYGTYNTASAGLDFLSSSIKTMKENKIIEQIETNRSYSKRISMSKVIEGEVEVYAYAESDGFNYMLQQAFGGAITTATATGETAGGLAFSHTYDVGNMTDQSYTSLCLNVRKGDSSGGMVFEYSGLRVNAASFSAEIDEALKCSFEVVGKDSTNTSNDVASVLGVNQNEPLSFVNGRISLVDGTMGGLTTTSFWHVQSAEFGISNNLKSDTSSRRIGSDVLDVLPPGIANYTLNVTMRFDTTTAYDNMLNSQVMAAELDFTGETLATSVIPRGLKFQFPKLYISEAGDPEIGGPDEMLTSSVTFHVLRDDSSASGYAMRAIATNASSSYA